MAETLLIDSMVEMQAQPRGLQPPSPLRLYNPGGKKQDGTSI
jgi:hypothetical protein